MYEQLQVRLREESRQSIERGLGGVSPRSNKVTRVGGDDVN
jgi:hypothetical protein